MSASKVWLTSSTKGMAEVTDVYSENHSIESENTLFNKCEDILEQPSLTTRKLKNKVT